MPRHSVNQFATLRAHGPPALTRESRATPEMKGQNMVKLHCAPLVGRRSKRAKARAATLALAFMGFCLLAACAQAPTSTPAPMPTSTHSVAPEATDVSRSAPPASSPPQIPALDADRTPVFISTDVAGDDHVALLYLLSHPHIQVLEVWPKTPRSGVGVLYVVSYAHLATICSMAQVSNKTFRPRF